MGHWFHYQKVARDYESRIDKLERKQPAQSVGVCVVLRNDRDQLLVGKRKNSYGAGQYGLPGGRLERGETLLAAALRELAEETGLSQAELRFVGVVREDQESCIFTHFVFAALQPANTELLPELSEPDKCEGWEWKTFEDVTAMLLPGHRAAVELCQTGQALAELVASDR